MTQTTPTPELPVPTPTNASAAGLVEPTQADRAFDLWFFRELTDDQRLSLIRLALGAAIAKECGSTHGYQRHAVKIIKHRLASTRRDDAAYAWVIEGAWSDTSHPDYWVGSSAWSGDHMKALRFARKEDAQQAANFMLDGMKIRICQHGWS